MREATTTSRKQAPNNRNPLIRKPPLLGKSSRASRPKEGKTSFAKDDRRDSKSRSKGKYSEKYKYIRFVERKKVVRKMRQIQQQVIDQRSQAMFQKLIARSAKLSFWFGVYRFLRRHLKPSSQQVVRRKFRQGDSITIRSRSDR